MHVVVPSRSTSTAPRAWDDGGITLPGRSPRRYRETYSTPQPSPMSLRRNSVASPQRIPHHADTNTKALNRSGRIASASAATSLTDRMTGSRLRGGFITRGMLHGLARIKPSAIAVLQIACSSP